MSEQLMDIPTSANSKTVSVHVEIKLFNWVTEVTVMPNEPFADSMSSITELTRTASSFKRNQIILGALGLGAVFLIIRFIARQLEIRAFKKANGCLPPPREPQPEHIIGLAAWRRLRRERRDRITLKETTRRAKELGYTSSLVMAGNHFTVTVDPVNLKHMLATNFNDFGLGPREVPLGPVLSGGIFISDGEAWQHSRALIRPAFTRTQVADLSSLESHTQDLLQRIPKGDGVTFDLKPLFYNMTLDSATDFLLGHSVRSQTSAPGSPARNFLEAFDYAEEVLQKRSELGKHAWIIRDKKFDRACKTIKDFTNGFIQEALRGEMKSGRYNLLAEIAGACRDEDKIRSELLGVLLAARDSTASVLSSAFWEMARNPDIWNKLMAEVETLGGRMPDYESLKEMKYLRALLNETLRLWPPLPRNVRFARKDTVLPRGGGPDKMSPVFVAKGSPVFYCVWAMHRLPEFWGPDADVFRPERWLEDDYRPGWAYLPFNGGPRLCIGQQNALIEGSYCIVRLMQEFKRLEPRDNHPWTEHLSIGLSNEHGCKVAFYKTK
ncbi:putative N-alkane-inducible cytochrome P450 [Annulohypoxylon bovei var. microspora]|nr:putative N-alkane-inducible cytochrome P450 [Annulohypoxylon bovei var. microspora]